MAYPAAGWRAAVSKERARRRAERQAERAAAEVRQRRVAGRRARRRALMVKVMPRPTRRAWLLARRSPGQRALAAGVAIGLLWAIWYLVPPWPLRIGLSLLVALLLPVFVILTFDRRV
jgi:Flp pilus assembly protein TadB